MLSLNTFIWVVPQLHSAVWISYLHHFDLQVFMERRRHPDGLQHLAEQLLVEELRLLAHEPVLTQQLLMGYKASNYQQIHFFNVKWRKLFNTHNTGMILFYLHSSECCLSQFGVFGLQSHLQGQQTALPAGEQTHKLKRQCSATTWSNTDPGLLGLPAQHDLHLAASMTTPDTGVWEASP